MPRWLRTCLGRPSEGRRDTLDFWTRVTQTTVERQGSHEAVLKPAAGDAWLTVTDRPGAPPTGLDIFADDAGALASQALDLGGVVDHDDVRFTLRSPGGMPFQIESTDRDFTDPPVLEHRDGSSSSSNQLCIDIAPSAWDTEVEFWANLIGDGPYGSDGSEFIRITPREGASYRMLLQRLEEERPTGAHLDFSCSSVAAVVEVHQAEGARRGDIYPHWTVMFDPSGFVYCLTATHPKTGTSTA